MCTATDDEAPNANFYIWTYDLMLILMINFYTIMISNFYTIMISIFYTFIN